MPELFHLYVDVMHAAMNNVPHMFDIQLLFILWKKKNKLCEQDIREIICIYEKIVIVL